VPTTARAHFDQDIARAEALLATSQINAIPPAVSVDIRRHAVAAAVGAMDAYLCDAYVDLLTVWLRHAQLTGAALPSAYGKEMLPAGPLVAAYANRPAWGLRMAARGRMEKDNMLQLGRVKDSFNPALPNGCKLWADVVPDYIALNRKRLARYSAAEYAALPANSLPEAKRQVAAHALKRMGSIVQRRHDVVHNCDRPKQALTALRHNAARDMIRDVKDFVTILDDHLQAHRIH
jgi:hypothetical protein